jgi:UDP-N-acetylmuramate dehydrogenase
MLNIRSGYSLYAHNTFKLQASADYYVECKTSADIQNFIHAGSLRGKKILILGEGSNILFTRDFSGIVLRPMMDSIEVREEVSDHIRIRAGAGLKWDRLVEWAVHHEYWGIENLSLIPGSTGAAPVQNIGAYGVELQETVESVETVDMQTGNVTIFPKAACHFSYRHSIFKTASFRHYVITHLNLILSGIPSVRNGYGDIARELSKTGEPGIQNIRETIIRIRRQKLPDPELSGNAGSFFKNPVIPEPAFLVLRDQYPSIPGFPAETGYFKIPAAWLIEQSGWKGKRSGETGTWPSQPLVIVNFGNATGKEILEFSEKIKESVHEKFGILLEREVNVV